MCDPMFLCQMQDGESALWKALGDDTELGIFQALLAGKADPNITKVII